MSTENTKQENHADIAEAANVVPQEKDRDEIAPEGASKTGARIGAGIVTLIFILTAIAPPRLSRFVPLLFVIPVIYAVVRRFRRASQTSAGSEGGQAASKVQATEPYSSTPRDPKDPRRYTPIE